MESSAAHRLTSFKDNGEKPDGGRAQIDKAIESTSCLHIHITKRHFHLQFIADLFDSIKKINLIKKGKIENYFDRGKNNLRVASRRHSPIM